MQITNRAPRVTGDGTSKRVQHRELIANLNGSVGFSVFASALNPGLSSTFPWLSLECQNYEMYEFHSLRFIYVPSCPTSTAGAIGIAIDFDAQDPLPYNEQEFLNNDGAVIGAVWQEVVYTVNPKNFQRQWPIKFVRNSAAPAQGNNQFNTITQLNWDLKTFDVGQLLLLTTGASAGGSAIGRVFAEYDVSFYTPYLTQIGERGSWTMGQWYFSTTTVANPLGVNNTQTSPPAGFAGNLFAYVLGPISTTQFSVSYMSLGDYFEVVWSGAGTGITGTPSITAQVNCQLAKTDYSQSTATAWIARNIYQATGLTASLTVGGLTAITTCTRNSLFITIFAGNAPLG